MSFIDVSYGSESELGKFLSNLTYSPFTMPEGEFDCIEGYWQWLGVYEFAGPESDVLRNVHGYEAVSVGKVLKAQYGYVDCRGFYDQVADAIWKKILSRPRYVYLLRESIEAELVCDPDDGLIDKEWFGSVLSSIRCKLRTADLWQFHSWGYTAVIPTNTCLTRDGRAVMGAGLALQASKRMPDILQWLGNEYREGRYMTHHEKHRLIFVPTKDDWRRPAKLNMVGKAADYLASVAGHNPDPDNAKDEMMFKRIAVPHIGCGLGGLNWEGEVKPLLLNTLPLDYCFVL